MNCNKCGSNRGEDESFCALCGNKLQNEERNIYQPLGKVRKIKCIAISIITVILIISVVKIVLKDASAIPNENLYQYVNVDNKYGYINKSGKIVIKPGFD